MTVTTETDADTIRRSLPDERQVGRTADWVLYRRGIPEIVHACLLGVGSSKRNEHDMVNHRGAKYAVPGGPQCSACRWFEPRIFRETGGQRRFIIYRIGNTIVPDELVLSSFESVLSPQQVIESLTNRDHEDRPYLTRPTRMVLAQAAGFDPDLKDAWNARVGR